MATATHNEPAGWADEPRAPRAATARVPAALDANVFVVCVLAACCAIQAALIRGAVALDAWFTLLGGRVIRGSGLPHRDTLAVMTRGHTWVDQQWLAHLTLYGLWRAGGWQLAGVVTIVLFTGAFAIAAATARALGASDRSTALLIVGGFLAGVANTVFRAQLVAYPLFAVVLGLLLTDARRPSRRVYLVLPLLALWANIHGSVILGAGLVSLLAVVIAFNALRARRRLRAWLPRAGALLILPWLCTLASPYGFALPGYYRSVLDNPKLADSVSEWGPSTLRGEPFFFALLLGGIVLAAWGRKALTGFAALALAGCALGGLLAVRNDVWFAIAAVAVLPGALDAVWSPSSAPRRVAVNVTLGVAAIVAVIVAAGSVALHSRSWFERGYPRGASAAVAAATRSDPSLKVFADERYADWLLFEDPALAGRIAYDIRFELLTSKQLAAIVAFRTEHGLDWQHAADGYGLLVLDPKGDAGAVKLYERLPGTSVLYRGPDAVVLRRAA